MKFFNTAGPINQKKHYYLPYRLHKDEMRLLIDQEKYFILHAPRQTGKTTEIKNFVDYLNSGHPYKALYINVEAAQAAKDNVNKGLHTILDVLKLSIEETFGANDPGLSFFQKELTDDSISGNELANFFSFWCRSSSKPIALFIDEIDSLIGETLISVLRQLRAGYPNRPKTFPQSVCLIGVRDIRDYRFWSEKSGNMVLGGSSFNIKAESLRLVDFSKEQVHNLYLQHTQETGQPFTQEALDYAFYITQGQPWLVNALAYEACFRDIKDRSVTITKEILEKAKETLIYRRDTHLDSLIDRLSEPRVRKIMDKIINSEEEAIDFPEDDLQYCRDLGILKNRGYVLANPIYQEILPRVLVYTTQESINQNMVWYQNEDGTINTEKLLKAFQEFYQENSESWLANFDYKESGPHLLLMAFLQRIINGGGSLHREYALGRKRVDLLIEWKKQKIVIEIKIQKKKNTLESGLRQISEYMDISHTSEGHLVIFDRDQGKSWEEKIQHFTEKHNDKIIQVWKV